MSQEKKALAIAPRPPGITALPPRATQPKKTRASRPKVRSGCISCKIRRIKCDEGKPTCQRCKNDGFDCGSDRNQGTSTVPSHTPTLELRGLPLLARKNPQSPILNQQDAMYFDLFQSRLVYELSGYTHSDFWFRIVLCESVLDDCAMESVLAISALSAAIRLFPRLRNQYSPSKLPSVLHPWSISAIADGDHKAAVCHYVKALSIFRRRLEAGVIAASPRSAFILSILFITFEMIQGDMNTVDRLITNSINLLKNTLKLYRRDICLRRGTQLTQLPTEDDMEDMEHLLPHVSIMSGYTPFLHAQSSNIHLWDPSNGTDLPCFGQPTIRRLQIQWEKFSTRATAFIGRSMGFQMLPSKTRETIQEQRQVLITQLKVWEAELDSRLPKNEVPVQQPIHRRTLQMMQIQHRMLLICICSCLDITDLAYDAHEADFYMLVMDCAIYFHEWRPSYLFTLSTSILSALIVVVTRCRVHNIRMMAAGLLRQLTWREGAWDPALMLHGKLGGVLMEERERDESGFIAPEFRWFWAGADWDAERKFIVAKYTRAVPDERNEPVIKTLLLEPEVCPDVCSAIGCFEDHDLEREGLLPRYRC